VFIIKVVFIFILFLALFIFGFQNLDQLVEIQFLNLSTGKSVPLFLAILVAFLIGAAFGVSFAVMREFVLLREIKKERKRSRECENELKQLRSLSITHEPDEDELK
jgi:uncharacterized integral membrane protein